MKLRKQNIQKLKTDLFDVLIIGGGINGAVNAVALASRDFASFTSQQSSNLIWGGHGVSSFIYWTPNESLAEDE